MEIDRQFRLVPDDPPAAHQAVQVVVVGQPFAHVGVALVPDRAADGVGHHRAQAAIEQPAGIAVGFRLPGTAALISFASSPFLIAASLAAIWSSSDL